MEMSRRFDAAALGGVLGPSVFVGAWLVGGSRLAGYSMVDDAISRLAAVDAPTRLLMSVGFVGFSVGVGTFSVSLGKHGFRKAGISAAIASMATLGVAALPLNHSSMVDRLHGMAATVGYVSLAVTPLLASGPLRRKGFERSSKVSLLISLISAASLAATVAGPAHGLFQRLGLTASDLWLVAAGLACGSGVLDGSIR